MLKNNLRSCLDCSSDIPYYTTLTHSITPQLYIIPQKSDIMTDAVSLDSDFLGELPSVIAAYMPEWYM